MLCWLSLYTFFYWLNVAGWKVTRPSEAGQSRFDPSICLKPKPSGPPPEGGPKPLNIQIHAEAFGFGGSVAFWSE